MAKNKYCLYFRNITLCEDLRDFIIDYDRAPAFSRAYAPSNISPLLGYSRIAQDAFISPLIRELVK